MKTPTTNIIILPSNANTIDAVIDNLIADGNDFSGNIVIFPNRRPAHFLRKKLALSKGSAIIPPDVFSIDEFIDYLYELDHKDIKIDSIDAVAILYKLHKKFPNRLGGEGFIQLDSFFPLGLKIFNDIEELCIEKITVSQVKNIDQFIEGIPPQTSNRLQSLSYFYDEFYKAIEKSGFSTRSSRYVKIAQLVKGFKNEGFKKIIMAGFFALTKAEVDIFKTFVSWDNSLLIFKDGVGIEERLREISIEFKSSYSAEMDTEINFYSSPDSHGQIFGLSSLIKDRLDNGLSIDENSLILAPSSDSLFPLIHNCLSLLDSESYNISMGYPIYRTPIFGFLNNLMELMLSINEDKFYLPNYIKFVLHPYTKNIHLKNKPELTRIIFHTIEEELSQKRTVTFLSLKEIENNDKILLKIAAKFKDMDAEISKEVIADHLKDIHKNTLGRFKSFDNIGDFARKCIELLIYIYDHSTARLHPLFYPFSEAFLTSLHKLSESLIKELSFEDLNGYFIFFRKYILTCNAPFEGTPLKGLQVLGFLETRNLTFENIYLIDINEGILPAINSNDSLIPFAVRKGLGLPTYLDSDKIAEYYFETLLNGAKQAHIFFIENDEMGKSRFIEKILWHKQKRDTTKDDKSYIKPIQYRITLKNPVPQAINKTERIMELLRNFRFTASSLDTYLKCGIAFYYSYVLNIRQKEDISGEIEKSDIGIFIHKVLRNFFMKIKGQSLSKKTLDIKKMKSLLESMYLSEFGNDISGAVYLIKKQIQSRLIDLLEKYYIPISQKCPIKVLETEYKISTKINGYLFEGRIDSIEERDKKTVIIDYKTSASENYYRIKFKKLNIDERDSWQDAIGSLQLPFYMLIYSEDKKIDIPKLNAMFLLLGKNEISEEIELPFSDDENSIIDNYEAIKDVIFHLLSEINDISLTFSPPKDLKKACQFCDYKNLCGTQ